MDDCERLDLEKKEILLHLVDNKKSPEGKLLNFWSLAKPKPKK